MSSLIVSILIEILVMVLITCIQTFFYYKTLGFAAKWRGRRLVFVILIFSVIGAGLELASINLPAPAGYLGYVFLVIMVLYPVLFMAGKRGERFFFGIVNLTILIFAALLGGISLNAILAALPNIQFVSTFLEIHIIQGPVWLMILLALSLITVIYALLVLLITRLNTEGRRFIPRRYWMGMMIGFAVIVVGLDLLSNIGNWIQDSDQFVTIVAIGSLVFLVAWLLLYFIFYFVCRYFSKAAEANTLAIQNDMIERYLLRKQASEEQVKILSHDLKHSLAQWRVLAEEKGSTGMLESISEYEQQLSASALYDVGNESANAIINQKSWEAAQTQVGFKVDGVFYEDLLVNKLDLCSLLGNLLDNALEAAMLVETDGLRRVILSIRRKGNLLILMVENGYDTEPVLADGNFVTHKKDKDQHAVGMLSIQHVAAAYDGVVNISYENNWFKATVMLCGYQNALSDEN